jgi:hypothetical protein
MAGDGKDLCAEMLAALARSRRTGRTDEVRKALRALTEPRDS